MGGIPTDQEMANFSVKEAKACESNVYAFVGDVQGGERRVMYLPLLTSSCAHSDYCHTPCGANQAYPNPSLKTKYM